jgi:hypothetical protein
VYWLTAGQNTTLMATVFRPIQQSSFKMIANQAEIERLTLRADENSDRLIFGQEVLTLSAALARYFRGFSSFRGRYSGLCHDTCWGTAPWNKGIVLKPCPEEDRFKSETIVFQRVSRIWCYFEFLGPAAGLWLSIGNSSDRPNMSL